MKLFDKKEITKVSLAYAIGMPMELIKKKFDISSHNAYRSHRITCRDMYRKIITEKFPYFFVIQRTKEH